MPNAQIAIVLATDTPETILPALRSLRSLALGDRLEIVLVMPHTGAAAASRDSNFADTAVVSVDDVYPLAAARAAGIRAAGAPNVFLGETHSFPQPGMFDAMIAAHDEGWGVVVPAFENANPVGVTTWAAFLSGYASWTPGLPGGEITYAPIFNASYSRDFLLSLGGALDTALLAGADMAGRIRAAGLRVRFEPAARIAHTNLTSPARWLGQRFQAGRVIAGTRSSHWSGLKRVAFAAATPLVPGVLLGRNLPGILSSLRGNGRKWRIVAAMVAGYMMQAAGEMVGYTAGIAKRDVVRFDEHEVRLLDFAGFPGGRAYYQAPSTGDSHGEARS